MQQMQMVESIELEKIMKLGVFNLPVEMLPKERG